MSYCCALLSSKFGLSELVRFGFVRAAARDTTVQSKPAAMITLWAAKIIVDGHNSLVIYVTTNNANQLSAMTTRSIPADLKIQGVNQ